MSKKGLIVFVKNPQKGNVKTRLAEAIGDDNALFFYQTCSENIFKQIEKLKTGCSIYVYFHGNDEEKIIRWVNKDFIFRQQEGSDLGERMKNSFNDVFNHDVNKVVIIGSDIPDISNEIINEAFNCLDEADLVIGPAKDGGYYLLGMKKPHDFLFEGINWSSQKVLNQTLQKLEQNFSSVKILKELIDIDTEKDLKEWLSAEPVSKLKLKIYSALIKSTKDFTDNN